MRLKRETQGAFCVLNANAKSQTRKSMKINVICTVSGFVCCITKLRQTAPLRPLYKEYVIINTPFRPLYKEYVIINTPFRPLYKEYVIINTPFRPFHKEYVIINTWTKPIYNQ